MSPPRITAEEARKLGLTEKQPQSEAVFSMSKKRKGRPGRDRGFEALCEAHDLPEPIQEYVFAPWEGGSPLCHHNRGIYVCKDCGATRRRWRFDFLFDGWLAVEKVGGVWTAGHHSRGQSQIDDMEKMNAAQIMGYVVLQFTPDQFDSGEAFAVIRRALEAREEQP